MFNVDTIKFYEIAKIHVKKTVFKFSSFDLGVGEGGGKEEQETQLLCSRFHKGPVRFKFWVLLVGPQFCVENTENANCKSISLLPNKSTTFPSKPRDLGFYVDTEKVVPCR